MALPVTQIKISSRAVPATFPAVPRAAWPVAPPTGGGERPNDPGAITKGERPDSPGGIGGDPSGNGLRVGGIRVGGIRVGGIVVSKLRIGEITIGGIKIGDLRVGEIGIGDLRIGDLRIGGLKIGGLRIGGLKIGGLRIGGLKIGGLRIGSLKIGGLRIGGLHDGLDGGGAGKAGKVHVDRTPVFHRKVFGVEPSGDRHLEILWECDAWGRKIRTVGVWVATANGREWTPETWDQYIPLDGDIPVGITYPQRGDPDVVEQDNLTWNFETTPHSTGTETGFDIPDPTGRVRGYETITLPVTSGETDDKILKAEPGQSIFPAFDSGWLSPAT